jgi:hypothetical protein
MVTVLDFVTELLQSLVGLVLTIIFDVILGTDPLSAVIAIVGGVLVTLSAGYFFLLAAGGLLNWLIGWGASAPDSRPPRRA